LENKKPIKGWRTDSWRAYMKNQEGLPEEALDYLSLMKKTFNIYHDIKSHEEYVLMIGKEKILDVSHFPQYLMMEAADPLPPEFERRMYHFKEKSIGGGIMDVVFKGNVLTNIRAQLFFRGFSAKKKAKKYLLDTMLPAFKSIFGEPYDSNPDNYWFKSSGIIGTACYVQGTSSVSFYLIDEKYA
jgi:hypothetical protein